MSDFETFFDNDEATTAEENQDFSGDIYKKWFKAANRSGFLSLREWFEAGKVQIDIGEITSESVKNTVVWTNAIELAAFLKSVSDGTADIYTQGGSPESFVYYGGGSTKEGPVSRILKIVYWKDREGNEDTSAFAFKTGHFKARASKTGAFIPDMSTPLSTNSIKISRTDVKVMSYRLDLALNRFITRFDGDAFKALNGVREK